MQNLQHMDICSACDTESVQTVVAVRLVEQREKHMHCAHRISHCARTAGIFARPSLDFLCIFKTAHASVENVL